MNGRIANSLDQRDVSAARSGSARSGSSMPARATKPPHGRTIHPVKVEQPRNIGAVDPGRCATHSRGAIRSEAMSERELVRYRGLVYDSARWEGFELRPDDIIISTPPKCGTTWTQMICALLILQTPELDRPLSVLSPWLDMQSRSRREVVADLEAQQHRRFIKTPNASRGSRRARTRGVGAPGRLMPSVQH